MNPVRDQLFQRNSDSGQRRLISNGMKKVLVITPFFYPHVGGSQKYMEDLYVNILKIDKNISVDVLCYNTDGAKVSELYRGLNIYRISSWNVLRGQFSLPRPWGLINFLMKHRGYDLIHTSTRFFDSSWWAPLFAKLTGTKIILTDHCAYHPVSGNRLVSFIVRLVEGSVVKFSLKLYDKVYVQNKKTKEFLKKTFGIDSTVAYPGIERSKKFSRTGNERIQVVYIGRLLESKGVKELFDIAVRNSQVDFTLVGEGPAGEFLNEAIKTRKAKNVFLTGNVDRMEIRSLLGKADVFVYPSWHSEGLPMAILEAGEEGTPVLATRTGAIEEIIEDGITGMLVEPRDNVSFEKALNRLIEDRGLREDLGRNLQKFVSLHFSWDKASRQILKELN